MVGFAILYAVEVLAHAVCYVQLRRLVAQEQKRITAAAVGAAAEEAFASGGGGGSEHPTIAHLGALPSMAPFNMWDVAGKMVRRHSSYFVGVLVFIAQMSLLLARSLRIDAYDP